MINVLVSAYAPFNTLNIPLDGCTPLSSLPGLIARRTCASADHNNTSQQRLTLQSGATLPASGALSSLLSNGHHQNEVHLRLALKLPGGKGGFGSQLRAAGGRMSTRGREDNTDSCRDLSGRRLSSVKEAQRVAKLTESAEEHEARRKEIQAKRLEELQGQVKKLEGSNSGTKRRREEVQGQGDDEDKSEERRDKGKSAIMAAMMKKRKKASGNNGDKKEGSSSSEAAQDKHSGSSEGSDSDPKASKQEVVASSESSGGESQEQVQVQDAKGKSKQT